MLKIDNIVVNYGNFEALHGISLDVQEGEIVALLGGNGAGKTTTINTISGTTTLMSGDILYRGKSLKDVPPYERVAMGIVQVPEGRKLFPSMTVYDNLLVGSYLPSTRKKRAENLQLCFEVFPKLAERKRQLAGSLSGGEQQMCAIARALMSCPSLLMLDEPSLGLAPLVVDQIFDTIVSIRKIGVTILLVEQNVLATLDVADRGYVIEVGNSVMNGSSDSLLNNEDMRRAYLGI